MKYFLSAALAATVLATAVAARADNPGGPPPPANPAAMTIMEQTHAKMEQLHSQARLAMLNALSPAHRSLLAQIVGQLVIAPTPDLGAAAKTLDASLAPGEASAVLNVSTSFEQQARQIMEASRKQMESAMPEGPPHGAYIMHGMGMQMGGQTQNDPGMVLLSMAGRTLGTFQFIAGPPGSPR
jgi:hypothetical protein